MGPRLAFVFANLGKLLKLVDSTGKRGKQEPVDPYAQPWPWGDLYDSVISLVNSAFLCAKMETNGKPFRGGGSLFEENKCGMGQQFEAQVALRGKLCL